MAKQVLKEYLSTGQAASISSVTPDTVLKWIKSGRLKALRTAGGHYRVHRDTLLSLLEADQAPAVDAESERQYSFCWEFYSKSGKLPADCQNCLVYRSRAGRCYEIGRFSKESGHAKLLCQGSCEECEYFRTVQGQRPNVLVVTDQPQLESELAGKTDQVDCNLRFSDCEYHCSMVVEKFRPDYVVIDCALGRDRSRDFARCLEDDPRIPYVRVILAGDTDEIPKECDKSVFAFMRKPIDITQLAELIRGLRSDSPAA